MSDWRTIDTAPRDGRFIDGYDARTGERRVCRWDETHEATNYTFWWPWYAGRGGGPTHWKPLPPDETERRPPLEGYRPIGSAPMSGVRILLYRPGMMNEVEIGRWDRAAKQWLGDSGWPIKPTMWRPIPHPARKEEPWKD
jgi:hypothetical protein